MADPFDARSNHKAPGDQYFDAHADDSRRLELATTESQHPMDSDEVRETHRRLLNWFYYERDKQSANRLEMAIDHDFYDGIQWDADDAAAVRERGQMPLVYNEVAPMADWMIGTERRTRFDWSVLPRTEDDVELADVKTKTLKYVSDVNMTPFVRSRSFADAIKGGLGWVEDGARDDPTKEVLYSAYADWRTVLHDSDAYDLGLKDGRYLFTWRRIDEDIALMMFPGRKNAILRAVEDAAHPTNLEAEEESWYDSIDVAGMTGRSGTITSLGTGLVAEASRRKVRVIQCEFRMPTTVKVVDSGPMQGVIFDERDKHSVEVIAASGSQLVDKVMMRMWVAVFTESDMLHLAPTIYRHNDFSLTPIWCYRRGRDRMPYGVIRRVRDIQQDLNKRASKALFMMNTNQIVAEEGAVEDWDTARDEVDRPDGTIITKPGKNFDIRRDTDAATGQISMMALDANAIQKNIGVADENLGRQTNAVSGEAIKARQTQGSVVTTEPFDNYRLTIRLQGSKQLALVEQFYTKAKVLRLTGANQELEWVRVNQPEEQPDGSVRMLNDITASVADFVVAEQDYSGTLRQVMFDSLNNIAGRVDPQVALRLLTIAFQYSDLPNKDKIADQFRKITGDRDESKEMTPEEQQQMQEAQQAQAEALQMQRESAMTALEEQRAKVREINARAAKLEADAQAAGGGAGVDLQTQAATANEIDRLSEELRQAQAKAMDQTIKVKTDADTRIEVARIEAASREEVARIQAASDERLMRIEAALNKLAGVPSMADSPTTTKD
jgi:hypothetical protein